MMSALFGFAAGSFTNVTVFHVNPASYAPAPINMDTGDALCVLRRLNPGNK